MWDLDSWGESVKEPASVYSKRERWALILSRSRGRLAHGAYGQLVCRTGGRATGALRSSRWRLRQRRLLRSDPQRDEVVGVH